MHTAAAAALLLLLGILLASSLLSEHAGPAFRRLSAWCCLAGWAYLIARTAGTAERLRQWVSTLALFGTLGSTMTFIGLLVRREDLPIFPFVNPNHNGALAAATLPLIATLWLSARTRKERLGWFLCLVPILAAVVRSRSSSALLALMAAVFTLLVGGIVWRRSGRGDAAAGAVAAVLVVVALGVPVLLGHSTVAERSGIAGVAHLEEGAPAAGSSYKLLPGVHWRRLRLVLEGDPDIAVASRLRFARGTILALGDEPILGYGPGSVPLTFGRHRLQVPGASEWGEAVGQLHSVGLQRLYECGLAGLSAFTLWVLFSVLGRPSADAQRAWLRVGLAATAAALAAAGAADALETAPALVAFSFGVLALMAARHESRSRERLPRWILVTVGAGTLLAVGLAAVDWMRADSAQRQAERAVRRVRAPGGGFDSSVYGDLRCAADLDPVVGLYAHQAAYAAEELALQRQRHGEREDAERLFKKAERLHVEAVQRFSDVYGFASQAGNFLLDRNRPLEAIPYLRKAVALDYYAPLGHFYLGEAYRLAGQESEGINSHARAIRYFPSMAGAAMWSDPDLAGFRRRVLERVRELLLEESSSHAPGSPSGALLQHVEHLLSEEAPPQAPPEVVVLAHRFDEIPGRARSRHIFARQGFTMVNLPVRVVTEEAVEEEARWAHVVDGLPALTAVDVERQGDWEALPWRLETDTDARPAKRPPRRASARVAAPGAKA